MIGQLLLLLQCGRIFAESHRLHYFYTAMTQTPHLPDFVMVGYLDDMQIVAYDSNQRKVKPLYQWLQKCEEPKTWEKNTQDAWKWENGAKDFIQILKKKANLTDGFHTYQRKWGCDLHENGKTSAFFQFSWDGQDFLFFDREKMEWQTAQPLAQSMKQQCDSSKAYNHYWKTYLEQDCNENLKKYLKAGGGILRGVPPQVFVTVEKASATNPAQLSCLLTGFYPRSIEVTLLRNGKSLMETESTGILPNHDGTYQFRRWAEIDPEDGATYSCQFDQSEKGVEIRHWDGTFRVTAGSPEGTNPSLIFGVAIGVAIVLIVLAIGGFLWKRRGSEKKSDYSPANSADSGESTWNSSRTREPNC